MGWAGQHKLLKGYIESSLCGGVTSVRSKPKEEEEEEEEAERSRGWIAETWESVSQFNGRSVDRKISPIKYMKCREGNLPRCDIRRW